jgi:DNA-binding beta-propeller fold protein YncE
MRSFGLASRLIAAVVLAGLGSAAASAQIMIVGNDQKPGLDDKGAPTMAGPGKDSLSIIDMSKPAALRMIATIPLDNTIVGPPTNLAITPNRELALVANSVNGVQKDGKWAIESDDRMFVIDLKANPPAVIETVKLGKRPSGMAINAAGNLALVTNRDDGTVSVLSISGKEVKVADTVTVGDGKESVAAVAITPDGKRALVANTGNGGSSDGHADTVSVIDLEAKPIRVIDHVTTGDSPEGLVISPNGTLAVTIEARGSNRPKDSWTYHPGGAVGILRINGKKVTWIGEVTVGVLPEGAVFSADGSYLYVGNFFSKNLSILRASNDTLVDTGDKFDLPGQPASMRGGPQ